jgi:hypothetical protein
VECGKFTPTQSGPAAAVSMWKIGCKPMMESTSKSGTALLTAITLSAAAILFACTVSPQSTAAPGNAQHTYLGFDRNTYPGDASLPILRKTFAFASYWISPPPGEKTNSWLAKRELLRSQGFGFLVLYRGRDSREFKNDAGATAKGIDDAKNGAASARAEGFTAGTIIFLDIEEGGRLPESYHAYLRAWYDELAKAGFHPGVYCSGIPVKESPQVRITTAADIRDKEAPRDFVFWIYNDFCPPAPGCAFPENPPPPSASGIGYAAVWQFAQSPRRKEFTAHCPANYHKDGNCYAPGDTPHAWFLDVNSASSPDPSGGAK